ncbi:unnamed protein product [marine sediment metagenome]|uniref:Uncharacterized protein n=1 Tax=marine sediment metagenome TaxID=412755 RepID=X1LD00_9ZZZZ
MLIYYLNTDPNPGYKVKCNGAAILFRLSWYTGQIGEPFVPDMEMRWSERACLIRSNARSHSTILSPCM